MFGMQDTAIALAWLLSCGSALICVLYGALNWNKGGDE